jgi:hypothetical protein
MGSAQSTSCKKLSVSFAVKIGNYQVDPNLSDLRNETITVLELGHYRERSKNGHGIILHDFVGFRVRLEDGDTFRIKAEKFDSGISVTQPNTCTWVYNRESFKSRVWILTWNSLMLLAFIYRFSCYGLLSANHMLLSANHMCKLPYASFSQPYAQACWDLFICNIWWFHDDLCAHVGRLALFRPGTRALRRNFATSATHLVQIRTCKRLGSSLAPSELIYRLSKGLASRNHVCLGLDHFWETSTSWFETRMLWILDPIRSNIAVRSNVF